MEEEMRKIEEAFAFQEEWIKLFKRGKFILQNISEHLILKIITKMEAKTFFKFLRTSKWMHLLCRENRDSLLISFDIPNYDKKYALERPEVVKKKRNQDIQQLRKVIRSKYYLFLNEAWYENLMEDLYSKEVYHFRRECWNTVILRIYKFPINISIINQLQPIILEISTEQNGPLSENFYIPARTKSFLVNYASISGSDFYKEIERFGSLPLSVGFSRHGHLELDELFSILKGITHERHLHHPLQFLTYKRESRTNYAIFDSWPMDSFFPSSDLQPSSETNLLFHFIIVAKSDVGVSVIYLYRFASHERGEYTLFIAGIKSFDEWEQFTNTKIFDKHLLGGVTEDFSTQIASKFFEGGKLLYPPLAPPEPDPELVEFLKEFEDFDIQPEKLAPHKPKWKKTEKLPDLPRKLPEIHSNNWLIEAKEVIKLRKFWMDFLQKKKFILKKLLEKKVPKFVLEIAKRIKYKSFPLLFSSTKWVNELIQNSASNFRIHGGSSYFSMKRICSDSSDFKKVLKSLEFYYLNHITFKDFNGDINRLKEALQWVRERKIFVKQIGLDVNCPLIQELFESFARGPALLCVSQYATLPVPIKFPPQLKTIVVDVAYFGGNRIKELMDGFTGIEQAVIWIVCNDEEDNTNKTITYQLETLKSKKCRSNILIRSWTERHPCLVNYNPQFDLSQISETVFIFRSMARGRGGVWNYFIRLEKAGTGAVGIAYFDDSLHVIEGDQVNYFDIRCDYFPTMERFLDYFEREVGSKRRARDWMQLREKDRTIEPREKDFNDYKMRMPYIHFNEQKEADNLKEVWRRFFS